MHCLALSLLLAANPTPAVDSLDVSGNVHVTVKRGDTYILEAEPRLVIEAHGNEVRIRNKPNDDDRNAPKVTLTLPALKRLKISGAAFARLEDVRGDVFAIDVSGATKLVGTGEVKTLTLAASGASHLDLQGLKSADTTIAASGASAVKLFASERLTAHVSGATKVDYWGAPKQVTPSISGASALTAH